LSAIVEKTEIKLLGAVGVVVRTQIWRKNCWKPKNKRTTQCNHRIPTEIHCKFLPIFVGANGHRGLLLVKGWQVLPLCLRVMRPITRQMRTTVYGRTHRHRTGKWQCCINHIRS
jgi:hypothetical protein